MQIVGETAATLGPDDLLVVMSDHGFTSWRRSFHLNSWLRDNGYLAVRNPTLRDDPGYFGNVDWSQHARLRAGVERPLHQRQRARRHGHRRAGDRAALVARDRRQAAAVVDPWTASPAITKVFRREAGVPASPAPRTSRPT